MSSRVATKVGQVTRNEERDLKERFGQLLKKIYVSGTKLPKQMDTLPVTFSPTNHPNRKQVLDKLVLATLPQQLRNRKDPDVVTFISRTVFTGRGDTSYADKQNLHINVTPSTGRRNFVQIVYFVDDQIVVDKKKLDAGLSEQEAKMETPGVDVSDSRVTGQGFQLLSKTNKARTINPKGGKFVVFDPTTTKHQAQQPKFGILDKLKNEFPESEPVYMRNMLIAILSEKIPNTRIVNEKLLRKQTKTIRGQNNTKKYEPFNVKTGGQIRLIKPLRNDIRRLITIFSSNDRRNWGMMSNNVKLTAKDLLNSNNMFTEQLNRYNYFMDLVRAGEYVNASKYYRNSMKKDPKYLYQALNVTVLKEMLRDKQGQAQKELIKQVINKKETSKRKRLNNINLLRKVKDKPPAKQQKLSNTNIRHMNVTTN